MMESAAHTKKTVRDSPFPATILFPRFYICAVVFSVLDICSYLLFSFSFSFLCSFLIGSKFLFT